ncbi:MAG TPA: 3'(2'),5'-bisphosphate nucleotidase CysQ [Haloplasmataceae bacterium]
MNYTQALQKMKEAARLAGEQIMEIYETGFSVNYKEDHSPVTAADLASNRIILDHLKTHFPDVPFLSEETADDLSRLEHDYCFIIDPIDGTKEFVNKNGEFTINIALSFRHEVVAGVIYAPAMGELFYAVKGEGSFMEKDGQITRLRVSDRKDKLVLAQSRSHLTKEQEALYEKYKDRIGRVQTLGSSLKGCYLAKGDIDAFYRFGMGTKEYDIAAMVLIVEEAGGIVRQLDNTKFTFNRKDIYNRKGYYMLNRIENLFDYSEFYPENTTIQQP